MALDFPSFPVSGVPARVVGCGRGSALIIRVCPDFEAPQPDSIPGLSPPSPHERFQSSPVGIRQLTGVVAPRLRADGESDASYLRKSGLVLGRRCIPLPRRAYSWRRLKGTQVPAASAGA